MSAEKSKKAPSNSSSTERVARIYEDFQKFVSEFAQESDRAAVILGAAKLDLQLFHLLQLVLRPSTGKTDDLLEGDSPLSTFSARTAMCHRLGMIDDELFRAINIVRRIRNSFAHELSGVSLSSGAHRDRVRELIAPMRDNRAFEWIARHFLDEMPGPAGDFRVAVAMISMRLDGALNQAKPLYRMDPFVLLPTMPMSEMSTVSAPQ